MTEKCEQAVSMGLPALTTLGIGTQTKCYIRLRSPICCRGELAEGQAEMHCSMVQLNQSNLINVSGPVQCEPGRVYFKIPLNEQLIIELYSR